MKLALTLLILCSTIFVINQESFAADLEEGKQIFSNNCIACHSNGNNAIVQEKTLKKEVLEMFDMYSISAITSQVKNGKNAMPAFGGRLADEEIENVAYYVLNQSEQGW